MQTVVVIDQQRDHTIRCTKTEAMLAKNAHMQNYAYKHTRGRLYMLYYPLTAGSIPTYSPTFCRETLVRDLSRQNYYIYHRSEAIVVVELFDFKQSNRR